MQIANLKDHPQKRTPHSLDSCDLSRINQSPGSPGNTKRMKTPPGLRTLHTRAVLYQMETHLKRNIVPLGRITRGKFQYSRVTRTNGIRTRDGASFSSVKNPMLPSNKPFRLHTNPHKVYPSSPPRYCRSVAFCNIQDKYSTKCNTISFGRNVI